jgi:hypothetical protein
LIDGHSGSILDRSQLIHIDQLNLEQQLFPTIVNNSLLLLIDCKANVLMFRFRSMLALNHHLHHHHHHHHHWKNNQSILIMMNLLLELYLQRQKHSFQQIKMFIHFKIRHRQQSWNSQQTILKSFQFTM